MLAISPFQWRLLPLLLLSTATLVTTFAATPPQPLDVRDALVFLGSSAASPPSCVAVRIQGDRLLTTASCRIDQQLNATNHVHASLLGSEIPKVVVPSPRTLSPIWSDTHTQLLSLPNDTPSALHLRLPHSVPYPGRLAHATNISIVDVDLDTGKVAITTGVVVVDKSQCLHPSTPSQSDEATVCITPLIVKERGVATISQRVQRFLIEHDDTHGGHNVLLGVGISIGLLQEHDGVRLFAWVANNFRTASFASLWSHAVSRDRSDNADRILGFPVHRIDLAHEFIVALREHETNGTVCAGALVAKRYVVTARQCLDAGTIRWAAIGALQKTGTDGEHIQIARAYPSPKYDARTKSFDVVVLELVWPSSRQPIELVATTTPTSPVGTRATVYGYGAFSKDNRIPSHVLRWDKVPLGPTNAQCSNVLGMRLDETMLCAGGVADAGACFGDLGAPLVANAGTSAQRLVGIVSRVPLCGATGVPQVYTSIAHVRSFIQRWATEMR